MVCMCCVCVSVRVCVCCVCVVYVCVVCVFMSCVWCMCCVCVFCVCMSGVRILLNSPNLSQQSLLDPPLHHPGILRVIIFEEESCYYGSTDGTGCVDNLLNTRDTESDMYNSGQGATLLILFLLLFLVSICNTEE